LAAAPLGSPTGGLVGGLGDALRYDVRQKHSGLGIASFLIAVMVGGMDIMMAVAITTNMARSGNSGQLRENALAGGMSMICLNCMSLPLCLVGAGLGVVALVAHRDQNHLFTWIGLLGNGVVIVALLGFYFLGAMVRP
jgi:hypothetical protein